MGGQELSGADRLERARAGVKVVQRQQRLLGAHRDPLKESQLQEEIGGDPQKGLFQLRSAGEYIHICVLITQSCPTLCDPMDAYRAPLSIGFYRQEYWSGLPFSPPGDLPHPGIEPMSPVAPELAGDSLPLNHLGSPEAPHNGPLMLPARTQEPV